MRLLITGAGGLVGSHFVENFKRSDQDIIFTPDRNALDITNEKSVMDFFTLNKPDTIIHFAAFTDVSLAEKQRDDKNTPCWIVNVEGTANLIRATDPSTYFIHISTDVIFPASRVNPGPYREGDRPAQDPNLVSWYGWTKKEAEDIVTSRKNSVILRISNPVRAKYESKLDYIRKILSLFDTNKLYPMFDDQYLTLTFIDEVTESLKILLTKKLSGIYHVSSINVFTPYKLATYLLEKARNKKQIVKPISIEEFLRDNPGRYPQFGGLNVEKTQKDLEIEFRTWEEIIDALVKQWSA